MPQALITIGGVPGSNEDLPIDILVQLDNVNIGGETTFLWTITDQPEGAADALSNTTIQNPTFTPKKEGTYRIRLEVNKGLGDEKIDTIIARVLQLKTLEGIPAAEETTEAGSKGWKIRVNAWLQRLDKQIADSGTSVAQAGAALAVNTVVSFSDVVTIKSGLPGEEDVGEVILKNATTADIGTALLGVVLSEVDGTTPIGNGKLAIVRLFGIIEDVAIAGATVGDTVFISDTGTLDRVGGTFQRRVGFILNVPSPGIADIVFNGVGGDAGLSSLQTAYEAGQTIAQSNAVGVLLIENTTDNLDAMVRMTRTFAGSQPALDIIMDPATTGNAIDISENAAAFGVSMKAAALNNQHNISSFGIQFTGSDNDFDFGGIANAGVGIAGRNLKIAGAPGSPGDVGTLGGKGGTSALRGGAGGSDGGFGGGAGGSLNLRGGPGVSPGADGTVDIADSNTSAIFIGNGADNPPTTFVGTGLVKADAGGLSVPANGGFLVAAVALAQPFTAPIFDAILRALTEVSATGDTTTTSPTDALMAGMTTTPGAGNYLVMFSSSFEHSTNGETIHASLYVNGVQVASTERQFQRGSGNSGAGLAFQAYVTGVTGGQAVEVRWRTSAATATAHERTLTLKEMP